MTEKKLVFHADSRDFIDDGEVDYEIFHHNTKLCPVKEGQTGVKFAEIFNDPSLASMMANGYRIRHGSKRIKLPKPGRIEKSLSQAVIDRRSLRSYDGTPIEISDLSDVLFYTVGNTGETTVSDGVVQKLRAVSSGGALYPIETYVIALNVTGLDEGAVLHYLPENHQMEETGFRVSPETTVRATPGANPGWTRDASFILVFTAVFVRMTYKYGSRGYRAVLSEAGAIANQAQLIASAKGKASCQIFGFFDEMVNAWVDCDGVNETVLLLCAVGNSKKNAV